ncbi:efflux transporter outer membrane subunit [Desulfomarina sp.]
MKNEIVRSPVIKKKVRFEQAGIILLLFLLTILSTGCSEKHDFQSPDMVSLVQEKWDAPANTSMNFDSTRPPDTMWWKQFHDDQLSRMITRLLSSNLTLKMARERIVELSARQGVIGAEARLKLEAALGYSHLKTGDRFISVQGVPPGKSIDLYSAGAVAGWELDLWGRTAKLLEAGEEDIRAGYADYHSLMVSLSAELALAYIETRTLQAILKKKREKIALQQKLLTLAKTRFQTGNSSRLDVIQTEQLLAKTRASLSEPQQQLIADQYRTGLLLASSSREKGLAEAPLPKLPSMIGIGLPIDLIKRRPDIRKALHNYQAAVARTDAAEAEQFPTLTLLGTLTLSSDSPGGVLNSNAFFYSLGPQLRIPLLTGNRIKSTIAVRASRTEQARLELEQQILKALSEVENGCAQIVFSRKKIDELLLTEKYARKNLLLAEDLYHSGLANYSSVLNSKLRLVSLQESLILAKQGALFDVVFLYRALGGGWENIMHPQQITQSKQKGGTL